MTMSLAVLPAGISDGSNASVTVTGELNVSPSGPKVYGVLTTVPAGVGALGLGVTVIVAFDGRAPAGTVTPVPPEVVTLPPCAPTTLDVVPDDVACNEPVQPGRAPVAPAPAINTTAMAAFRKTRMCVAPRAYLGKSPGVVLPVGESRFLHD